MTPIERHFTRLNRNAMRRDFWADMRPLLWIAAALVASGLIYWGWV